MFNMLHKYFVLKCLAFTYKVWKWQHTNGPRLTRWEWCKFKVYNKLEWWTRRKL